MAYGLGHDINQDVTSNNRGYNVSDKYIPTSTDNIITELQKFNDFEPVGYSQVNVRKAEKEGTQKHMTMLQASDSIMPDGNLRLVLFNSHDRSSSIKMYMGYYRDACANSCVFGQDAMEPISIRHTKKDWQYSIYKLMQQYDDIKKQTTDMIERMMKSRSSHGDASRFNHAVAEMLNSDLTGTILDPMQLGNAHRLEDVGMSQWLIYQRAQSNVINGGVDRIIERVDEETGSIKKLISKTHKVTDQQKIIDYNIKLNNLALELL